MTKPELVQKFTVKLEGDLLVMDVYQWTDYCRVEILRRSSPTEKPVLILLQRRPTMELAIAAIARDFTTYAVRALAALPTIGALSNGDEDDADKGESVKQ